VLFLPLVGTERVEGLLAAAFRVSAGEPVADRRLEAARAVAQLIAGALERDRLQAALRDARRSLAGLDQARRRLVTLASHELLTPITLVAAHADLLTAQAAESGQPDEDEALLGLRRGLQRLMGVAQDLLTLETLDRGELKLQLAPVDVGELLTNLAEEMLPLARRRRLRLLAEPPPDPEVILADSFRLQGVLGQLILNAVRFTPDHGTVVVGGAPCDGGVRLWVSDTGIGIAPEHHELIFERLVELGSIEHHHSDATGFRSGGLGLGLAVAREVVRAHGGEMWLESEVGRGSDFYLRLPRGGPSV